MRKNSYIVIYSCITAFLLLCPDLLAQKSKIDSLLVVLKSEMEDTNKVKTLNAIAWKYYLSGDTDSSLTYATKAKALATQLNYPKGQATAYNTLGSVQVAIGNYPEALFNHQAALHSRELTKDKTGIAKSFMNIGVIYEAQADYPKAIEYYFKALDLCKTLNNQNGIEITSGNIGNVYYGERNYKKALEYYLIAMKIAKEIGNENNEAAWMGNIGIVYSDLSLENGGDSRKNDSLSKLAFFYYENALALAYDVEDKNLIALNKGNIGNLHLRNKNYQKAEQFLESALSLSDSIGDLDGIKEWEKNLSDLYYSIGKFESAFLHYKRHIAARDSLKNDEDVRRQTQLEMNYDFDKKTEADSIRNVEQKKRDELKHEQEIKQHKLYTYGGIGGFVLMLVVAIVSIRAYRTKQKTNKIISHQKALVEEKQKEILDSIHYARRIQKSLLPTEKYIDKNLTRLKN